MTTGKIYKKRSKVLTASGLALMAALAFGCINTDQVLAQTSNTIRGGAGAAGGFGSDLTGDPAGADNGATASTVTNTDFTNVVQVDPATAATNGNPLTGVGGNGESGYSYIGKISDISVDPTGINNLSIIAGTGGKGGVGGADFTPQTTDYKGGNGGGGGNATVHLDQDFTFNNVTLMSTGGDGGDVPNTFYGTGGNGGVGGTASLIGQGNVTATLNGILALASNIGTDGINNGSGTAGLAGQGGNIEVAINGSLRVASGQTATVNFSSNTTAVAERGTFNVTINNLSIEDGATFNTSTSTISDLAVSDNVSFGTIRLGSSQDGGATFNSQAISTGISLNGANISTTGRNNTLSVNGVFTTNGGANGATTLAFDATGLQNGDTMLTVTNGIDMAGIAQPGQVVVYAQGNTVQAAKASHRALSGQRITLIDYSGVNIVAGSIYDNGSAPVSQYTQIGTSRFYYSTTAENNGSGLGLVYNGDMTEYSLGHAYAQAAAAGLITATASNDNTMNMNSSLINYLTPDQGGVTGSVSMSTREVETGSRADVDTTAASIAAAYKFDNGMGQTTVGAFVEYGDGSYDTSATIAGWGKVKGDGDATNFGGGLFAHNEFLNGTYVEGSLRFGNVDQEYKIKNVANSKFDTDANYWGAHLGLGHKIELTDCAVMDIYGKFLYTSIDSMSAKNKLGEQLKIDSADSMRSRIGARVTQGFTDSPFSVYYGAAWEHEFDGETRASVDGLKTKKADISGSSGLGELGFVIKPADVGFSLDVGVFGLVGQQEGGGGTAVLKYTF